MGDRLDRYSRRGSEQAPESGEGLLQKVLLKLEHEAGVWVRPDSVQIIRTTRNGFNIYLDDYIVFYNVDKGTVLIRSNHYLEPGGRGGSTSRWRENSGF